MKIQRRAPRRQTQTGSFFRYQTNESKLFRLRFILAASNLTINDPCLSLCSWFPRHPPMIFEQLFSSVHIFPARILASHQSTFAPRPEVVLRLEVAFRFERSADAFIYFFCTRCHSIIHKITLEDRNLGVRGFMRAETFLRGSNIVTLLLSKAFQ